MSSIRDDVWQRRAFELVSESEESVDHIASRLGYTNSSNFTRAFRGLTAKSPSDFRRTR
ncbi:helix-turn-helix domain-containing protein [Tateyamaria sp.]|uniref:helix-turn-helix domain-containing protein n=1 Tax=Tateyamaria sp. TaxID=1929288 RepID=UPI0039B97D17